MPNTQYAPYPAANWSSEISAPQPTAHAHSTTSTTTTTTSSATAGAHGFPMPVTTTVTDTDVSTPAAGAAQRPQSYPTAGAAQQPQSYPAAGTAQQPQSYPAAGAPAASAAPAASGVPAAGGAPAAQNEFAGSSGTLDLETHQPIEVIESPASMNEAFLGSLKSMLLRNRGNFVTATFLIGTQGTTNWEGLLHDVGNDYIVIFQPARQRYIACDIYSLKYIEFYDTKQQEMCQQLLRSNGLL